MQKITYSQAYAMYKEASGVLPSVYDAGNTIIQKLNPGMAQTSDIVGNIGSNIQKGRNEVAQAVADSKLGKNVKRVAPEVVEGRVNKASADTIGGVKRKPSGKTSKAMSDAKAHSTSGRGARLRNLPAAAVADASGAATKTVAKDAPAAATVVDRPAPKASSTKRNKPARKKTPTEVQQTPAEVSNTSAETAAVDAPAAEQTKYQKIRTLLKKYWKYPTIFLAGAGVNNLLSSGNGNQHNDDQYFYGSTRGRYDQPYYRERNYGLHTI